MTSPTEFVSFVVAAQGQGNPASPLIMMILMFVIMYFLLIRPQKMRQKELDARISKIKTGDKILSSSGIHGLVTNVKDTTVMVKVADNVKIEFEKSAIANIFPKDDGSGDAIDAEVVEETAS